MGYSKIKIALIISLFFMHRLERLKNNAIFILSVYLALFGALIIVLIFGEEEIFDAINNVAVNSPENYTVIMVYISDYGRAIFLIPIVYVLSFRKKKREENNKRLIYIELLIIGLFFLITSLVVDSLKEIIKRERPPYSIRPEPRKDTSRKLFPVYSPYSFPSGHATSSFLLAGIPSMLVEGSKNQIALYRAFCLTLAVIIAFSRLWLGVHYPLDTIAGAILGWSLGILAVVTIEWAKNKQISKNNQT